MRTTYASVDEYVAAQPPAARRVLQKVRATIRAALLGASESISYQIPTYKLDGEMVCYFAGHRAHYALYPVTARALRELEPELGGALHGKATIRFAYDDPVPTLLIRRFVAIRAAEAEARGAARAAKKGARKATAAAKSAKPAARKTKPAAKKAKPMARKARPAAKTAKPTAKDQHRRSG